MAEILISTQIWIQLTRQHICSFKNKYQNSNFTESFFYALTSVETSRIHIWRLFVTNVLNTLRKCDIKCSCTLIGVIGKV